jgi:hypothetical protein
MQPALFSQGKILKRTGIGIFGLEFEILQHYTG